MSLPKILTSSGFLLAILCFFFNFMTISCSEQPVATISGITLLMGGRPEAVSPEWSQQFDNPDAAESGQNGNAALTRSRPVPMQPIAAITVLLALLGIFATWGPGRLTRLSSIILSSSAIISLFALRYSLSDFKSLIEAEQADLPPLTKEDLQFINLFTIDWGMGYWGAIFFLFLVLIGNLWLLLTKGRKFFR
ncbi:MAG: hypothetical protein QM669_16010 [Siphonobacter sp.]